MEQDKLDRNKRYILLKLNTYLNTLENVDGSVLSREYKQKMKPKEIKFDENNPDTYFLFKWDNIGNTEDIGIKIGDFNTNLKFKRATAICEFSTKKVRDSQKNILPKEQRLNTQETDVLFVENNLNVYAIVYTFDTYELRRVKKLIGENMIDTLDLEYQIVPEVFTWLFYKYISEQPSIGCKITINGISGFTGNILSDENRFSGDSDATADLLITKAFLANQYSITSMKIDLSVESATTSFYVSQNSSKKELRMMALNGSMTSMLMNNVVIYDLMPMYVYFYLIPEIFNNYKHGKKEFEEDKQENFLSKLAIEVIQQIMKRNGLTKDDIE